MSATAQQIQDRKFWLEFIKDYRSFPCLWDVENSNYGNRKAREHAFFILLKKVREFWPEAELDFVKQRINNFRRTFINEYNKVQQSKKDGTTYVPSLYYYNDLRFLKEDDTTISSGQSEVSDEESHLELSAHKDEFHSETIPISDFAGEVDFIISTKAGSSPTNEFYLVPSSNNEEIRPMKRQRLQLQESSMTNADEDESSGYHLEEVSENNANTLALQSSDHLKEKHEEHFSEVAVMPSISVGTLSGEQTNNEDEFDVIAKRVALHFRKMSQQQCLYAEKLVFDICINGRLNRLTEETNISLLNNTNRNNDGSSLNT